ncbi:putative Nudix hydrolase NudL [Cupriavidus campinensis]|uniref:CoA pyrophosphatase n=1 Tax=Cupriavidus campinensis TaxID=151783 RepID=A0AAE9L2K8_9BURK|nr:MULTISPECIES: CoA pyrophosphatase [Cupriavidus]TSP13178.1 CoA pyrophosphatase [Cupriavidus campinensis]URF04963.1 CoA pyrophosphatase [Cupriavidus campinensis]CAG2132689.1 putative Nudix hydrolase NudL [Cupriavidus campinensis]
MRPKFDPETLPVIGTDALRAPLSAPRMRPDFIRHRLLSPPAWEPELTDESRVYDRSRGLREAAVLVPLVDRTDGLTVLLTERNANLNAHAGQISFPGGRQETYDADRIATALRETKEEIGLDRDYIEVLGSLPDYITGTGYHVSPIVGLVRTGFALEADAGEVADIFEVPLAFLMDPSRHERRLFRWEEGERQFYSMPYPREEGGHRFIWGATAGMLRNLYHLLAA